MSLLVFLKTLGLAMRLHAAMPTLSVADAYQHAAAANHAANQTTNQASTRQLRPELLLAIAFVESRYDATATSRVEAGRRITGRYASTEPPTALDRRASLYCGPLQTQAATWSQCMSMRELDRGYATGVRELEQWMRDIRVRGDITRALAGHACGNVGVTSTQCNNYPARVHWIEQRLIGPRPARPTSKTPARRVAVI